MAAFPVLIDACCEYDAWTLSSALCNVWKSSIQSTLCTCVVCLSELSLPFTTVSYPKYSPAHRYIIKNIFRWPFLDIYICQDWFDESISLHSSPSLCCGFGAYLYWLIWFLINFEKLELFSRICTSVWEAGNCPPAYLRLWRLFKVLLSMHCVFSA